MSHVLADSNKVLDKLVWTIVVAGGSGLRFGGRKQFADLGGRSVLQHSVDAADSASTGVVVVVPADSVSAHGIEATSSELIVVAGGASRAASVREGLAAVPESADLILVHDAARPLASPALFARVIESLATGATAAVPAVAVADTIRHRSEGVVDREQLLAIQTPQGFTAEALRNAHASGRDATDDASLVELLGHSVMIVEGDAHNRKLTEPTDLISAEALIDHLLDAPE